MFTPLRWLQLTTLAAAVYATAGIIDGLTESFNMSRQLSGAIDTTLGVGFILSGGACLLERYGARIAAQLAEAHEEREEFRRRFEALAASLGAHGVAVSDDGLSDNVRAFELGRRVATTSSPVNGKGPA